MIQLGGTNDLVVAYMEAEEPTVLHWRKEQYSMPWEAIERSDTNELGRILLSDEYLAKFKETYWYAEPWKIESYYIRWRQYAAIEAAKKRPAPFAYVLAEYYFGSMENAKKMSAEEQIRTAALKQIEQGKLYVDGLGEGKKEYKVEEIKLSGDKWLPRVKGKIIAEDIVDESTGEVLLECGEVVTESFAQNLFNEKEKRQVGGKDRVIHAAAAYSFWTRDRGIYREVNVDGARNVMECALEAGVWTHPDGTRGEVE